MCVENIKKNSSFLNWSLETGSNPIIIIEYHVPIQLRLYIICLFHQQVGGLYLCVVFNWGEIQQIHSSSTAQI